VRLGREPAPVRHQPVSGHGPSTITRTPSAEPLPLGLLDQALLSAHQGGAPRRFNARGHVVRKSVGAGAFFGEYVKHAEMVEADVLTTP